MKIRVRASDIAAGIAGECHGCPVAIALQRATKDSEASVTQINFVLYLCVWSQYIVAPVEVREFVLRFDSIRRNEDDQRPLIKSLPPAKRPKPIIFEVPEIGASEWRERCYGCDELRDPEELDAEGICREC
jgi:hypothetical protein